MNISSVRSMAFWTTLAGIASVILGALHMGGLSRPVATVLIAIGGLLIAIPAHHVIAKQQGTKPVTRVVNVAPGTPISSTVWPGATSQTYPTNPGSEGQQPHTEN